jgi:hypothetical protein
MARAIFLFLFGFVLHQAAPVLDVLPAGWGNLMRSAIGVLAGWPSVLAWGDEFQDVPDRRTRLTLRFWAGFVPLGLGVVMAYVVQHFFTVWGQEGKQR